VETSATEVGYRPGIDGLRALAVTAVLLYHADIAWLPGGFLGVDVFFAISGYLICSLLLAEHHRDGAIGLKQFWVRRARRLLPALVALLVATTAAVLVTAPDAAARLRGDLLAALGYVSNWWQVFRGESYFESMGRPPLLRHLWSLAVEEQFYLVFPVLLAVGLRVVGHRRRLLAWCAVAAGVVSTLLMAALYRPDGDPSRVWYGTDTRAVGLCLGVALAFVWSPWRLRYDIADGARRVLDAIGVVALVALVVLMMRLDEFHPALYRGGFAATAVVSCVLIAVAAHPATWFGCVLGIRPLRWLGRRSYAVYLWHWPVYELVRPGFDVHLSWGTTLALRLAITAVLSELSWRLVEQPFRRGAVVRVWRTWPAIGRARAATVAVAVVVVLVVGLVSVRPASTPALFASSSAGASSAASGTFDPTVAVTTSTSTTTTTSAPAPTTTVAPPVVPVTAAPPPPPPRPLPAPVLMIGDSVMLASKNALVRAVPSVWIDAAVGRQVDQGLDALQAYKDAGNLAKFQAVVIHLGTNGPLGPNHFERLSQLLAGIPRVVVLDVRVPRRWEQLSDDSIHAGVAAHLAQMRLAPWRDVSGAPGMLRDDGVHPTPPGMDVYARVVLDALRAP
jgi:peptidoglycan/LPS O-acetylase OafA/YrhL